jgi:hypothetical protein
MVLLPFARKNAEDALQGLNGSTIGKQNVRLSWGRNPANKQVLLTGLALNYSTSKRTAKLCSSSLSALFCRLFLQFRGDNGNQWNNGGMYYAAPPFYNGYGYPAAAPFPDPGMYAAPAYGAYPFYGNQQQVS